MSDSTRPDTSALAGVRPGERRVVGPYQPDPGSGSPRTIDHGRFRGMTEHEALTHLMREHDWTDDENMGGTPSDSDRATIEAFGKVLEIPDERERAIASLELAGEDVSAYRRRWNLRDPDNRGDDGIPHEAHDLTLDQVIGYLDGPLRRDLEEHAHARLDDRIAALRAGWIPTDRYRDRIFGVEVWPTEEATA